MSPTTECEGAGAAPLQWLQENLQGAWAIAHAGPVLVADTDARYGSASTHFAMVTHDRLNDSNVLRAFSTIVDGMAGSPAQAAKAMSALTKQVPVMLEARCYAAPNGIQDLPQILACGYYGRVACSNFKAGEGSPYGVFLERMQWLQLKVIEATNRSAITQFGQVIEEGEKTGFKLDERIRERLRMAGRDLLPTPSAVIAAVGIGCQSEPNVYPLHRTPFVNFVRGIDAAFWESGRSFVQPTTASKQVLYLVHTRAFLADTAKKLSLSVLPCDRSPIVAPWYASMVLGARAYAATVAHVLTEKEPRPINTNVEFTQFSLMSMAAGADSSVPDTMESLFNSKSKSMYTKTDAQDGQWWTLLRTTLSATTVSEAHAVGANLVRVADTATQSGDTAILAVCQNAALLCVLMHTQTGMAVVGLSDPSMQSDDIANFPVAQLLLTASDPVCGQNAIDLIMATYSGTCDLERLASNDLAFTAIDRQEEAWTREVMSRVEAGVLAGEHHDTPSQVCNDAVANKFCGALRAVGMEWVRKIREAGEDGRPVSEIKSGAHATTLWAKDVERTLQRMGTCQSAQHSDEWMRASFDIARVMERNRDWAGEPALITSPIDYQGSNAVHTQHEALKDEAYLRLNFRMQTEHALHNSRRAGLWDQNNTLILAAWLSTPDGVKVFSRVLSERESSARLFTPGWREEIERTGADSVVDSALEFERALHARNVAAAAEGGVLPSISRHSSLRSRAAAVSNGPLRFEASVVGALDESTSAALGRLREMSSNVAAHDKIKVNALPFMHGCSVAVVALPPPEAVAATLAEKQSKLVEQRWPGRNALMQRLAKFKDTARAAGGDGP
jgi:hypothetical protein